MYRIHVPDKYVYVFFLLCCCILFYFLTIVYISTIERVQIQSEIAGM